MLKNKLSTNQFKKNHCLHDICFMFEFLGFLKKNVNYKNYCCCYFVVIFVHFCYCCCEVDKTYGKRTASFVNR